MSVALDAGFNSKTTFNTVFKKMTGVTPSIYRSQKLMCFQNDGLGDFSSRGVRGLEAVKGISKNCIFSSPHPFPSPK
jgi:hypothetical protein